LLVENYSNSRSLQTLSAAEAIFSGLRANRTIMRKNNTTATTELHRIISVGVVVSQIGPLRFDAFAIVGHGRSVVQHSSHFMTHESFAFY